MTTPLCRFRLQPALLLLTVDAFAAPQATSQYSIANRVPRKCVLASLSSILRQTLSRFTGCGPSLHLVSARSILLCTIGEMDAGGLERFGKIDWNDLT